MAELRLRTIDEAEIETIIGEDIKFSGTLRVDHPALIKGQVNGAIQSTSDLYIHKTAQVDAEIQAETLSVKGEVKGKAKIVKRIELFQAGVLEADISTPDLLIQSGSTFNGTCSMDKEHKPEPHMPSPKEIAGDSL